jgi:DNA-binding CsgD family transcriptional regulator
MQELSPRQREVLVAIAEGRSRSEIAKGLGISVKTVEVHRGMLQKRLGIKSTAGLVRFAVASDLRLKEAP